MFQDRYPVRFQFVVLAALAWHAWQCFSFPDITNLRTSIAVTMFAGVAALAPRLVRRSDQILPLRLFAAAGLLVLLGFIEFAGRGGS
ncbi:MAG: hypothetical protein QNJ73_01605 [Gammaproteobacteria bacterium]|nr:hypothetical protein [Gammaproteobacteria bacterium]